MNFRKFQHILRQSARIPVTRDKAFVDRIVASGTAVAAPARPLLRRLVLSASAVVFAALTVTFGYLSFDSDYTVTLDVNPAFELRINHFGRVVSVVGHDEIARALAAEAAAFNQQPEQVVSTLYAQLAEAGYVRPGGVVLLGVEGDAAAAFSLSDFEAVLPTATVLALHPTAMAATDTIVLLGTADFRSSVIESEGNEKDVWQGIIDAFDDATEAAALTTTAGFPGTTNDDPLHDDAVVAITLDAGQFTDLAASLGVTEAKLLMAITVFNGTPGFRTMIDLEMLARMPVADLYVLYDAVNG